MNITFEQMQSLWSATAVRAVLFAFACVVLQQLSVTFIALTSQI